MSLTSVPITSPLAECKSGPYRFDVECHFDIVADQKPASFECRVPGQPEVLAIEPNRPFEGGEVLAVRITRAPEVVDRQLDVTTDTSYGQSTVYGERIGASPDDAIAHEGEVGMLLHREEIIRTQVHVAVRDPRVDRRCIDPHVHAGG